jgi:anti-sigma regulatory factor (Ser/Thr protein kinase)
MTDAQDGAHAELAEDLTAPAEARALTRRTMRRWSLPGLLEPVTLAVSELVANAVRHGRPPVAMSLSRLRGRVRVEVHDEAPARTVDRPSPAEGAESGRGLLIVEALADGTGIRDIDGDGKVVWADFSTDPDDDPGRLPDADRPNGSGGS